jgi:biotin carboxyl carrier protein
VVVIEAMKMNTNINAPVTGKVKDILVKAGDPVQQGQLLMVFE